MDMNVATRNILRSTLFGSLLVCALVVFAADETPDSSGTTMSDHLKAAAAVVKRNAQVVGSAVKQGAQKVGVEAKKTAHTVADATKKGAHEIGTAAKGIADKSKSTLKSAQPKPSESKRSP